MNKLSKIIEARDYLASYLVKKNPKYNIMQEKDVINNESITFYNIWRSWLAIDDFIKSHENISKDKLS